jgi:hypothetical protein
MNEAENQNNSKEKHDTDIKEETVPIGIIRIREEWKQAGLTEIAPDQVKSPNQEPEPEIEPVIFPEVNGGAGIGDYTIDYESVADRLGLSQEAVERLVGSGELDSILVRGSDGQPRRLVSESSLARFQEDAAIDPEAIKRAAKAFADKSIAAALDELRAEIEDLKATQGKILQQMKDILLLEVRNLKEQDRDLTSFVYELAEEIRQLMPKKKRR